MERTFMNAGMLLAIFGLAATAEAIALFAGALTGNPPERMIAVGGRAMMAVLCGAFILFRLKEFLKTMKSRKPDNCHTSARIRQAPVIPARSTPSTHHRLNAKIRLNPLQRYH
jgi:hypothetical protein